MTVIIGMDPHKRSATIEVIDHTGKIRAVGRYGTDKAGYTEMLTTGRKFGNRVWAVEGCNGIGRHIAHRLVHDGETVLDVPAKLSAQIRVFATGNGRKTDPVDAHSVAMAALHSPNLRRVEPDPDLLLLSMGTAPSSVDSRNQPNRGQSPSMESMRSLKRRLSNVVYARMLADQRQHEKASPGGHSGTTLQSSATGLTPHTDPSEKPLPGPATNKVNPAPAAAS